MRHGIPGVFSDIENQAVPTRQPFQLGDLLGEPDHLDEHLSVDGAQAGNILDMTPGNHQDMGGGDGTDVPEGNRVIIGSHLLGREVSGHDSTEEAVGHVPAKLLPDDAAARFLWDARISESARARAREHWLRQQAREAATFAGILRALSERGGEVFAWTYDGGTATGIVEAVSSELALVASAGGGQTWIVRGALSGVTALSEGLDAGVASDDRGPTSAMTLGGLLAELAEARASLTARCGGREEVGRLIGAGSDVLTLRLPEGGITYFPVTGLSLLRLA